MNKYEDMYYYDELDGVFDIEKLNEIYLKNKASYEDIIYQYNCWMDKYILLPEVIKCLQRKINFIIGEFYKKDYILLLDSIKLDDDINVFISSRLKGLQLINRMIKNLDRNLIRLWSIKNNTKIKQLNKYENIENFSKIISENNNILSTAKEVKNNLIRNYLQFINSNILSIVDGIYTALQFINSSKINNDAIKIIKKLHLDIYYHIISQFERIGINRIDVKKDDSFNVYIHDAFDIENTQYKEKDEKVYEVIREGYYYSEPLFDMDKEYIIRPAQVIVYKYDELMEG